MTKKTITLVALIAVVFSMIAVGMGPAKAQKKHLKIALSLPDLSFPFFVHMVKQVQDEAAKIGDIEIVVFDGQNKTDKQTADLESVVIQKFDGLLISPLSGDAMAPAVQDVIDAKVPVVTIDRNVLGDTAKKTLAHVGADNVKGGEEQSKLIIKMFPKGAKVFNLQGQPGTTPAIDRNKGLHNILDGKKEYEIIFEQTANFRRADGITVTENGLSGKGTPDVISAANDEMAFGAVEALKGKGLSGKVVVLGYDALPEALLAVKNGDMTGTVEQFPGGQSRAALNTLVTFLRDGKSPAEHDNYLPPVMITKDNLKDAERLGEIEATPAATGAATMAPTAAK
jgi:ABC-type sugar transport system substrate-binding protein